MSDLLDRFHRVLVQEIRRSRPEYLEGPFTVAEIYQDLVPYRTHRDAIGVEMNGDYEDVLLRLLSGDGEYLVLESEVARREIKEELESSNPNTGLFRDFAAADVRLTGAHQDVPSPDDALSSVGDEEMVTETDLSNIDTEEVEEQLPDVEVDSGDDERAPDSYEDESEPEFIELDLGRGIPAGGEEMDVERVDSATEEDEPMEANPIPTGEQDVCHWCREGLPERSVLNYCPFCGSDLRLRPCAVCDEELEPGWRFCPACGGESDT